MAPEKGNESARKIADGLSEIFAHQKEFQEKHGFDFWKLSPEKRRDMFIRQIFAAMSELAEAGDEVNKWWKKGCKEPEALEQKKEEILEEMVDVLHFYMGALLTIGCDGKDVADAYLKKLSVNHERQKDAKLGYV
jgi:dimeric dUTPase (all-alpha-NTP-PPase superfamily)